MATSQSNIENLIWKNCFLLVKEDFEKDTCHLLENDAKDLMWNQLRFRELII